VIAGEEGSDKVVPPVSSKEKEKEKERGRKGLRAEAGWAGSFPGWLGRFGPRTGPSGLASSFLFFFLFCNPFFIFCFFFFYNFCICYSNDFKPISNLF
jgi:hypothetical protein